MVGQSVTDKRKAEIAIVPPIPGLLLNQHFLHDIRLSMKFKKGNEKFNKIYLGAVWPTMKNTDVRVLWT